MSKPNTIHIIGFNVNTNTLTVPGVGNVNPIEGVYVAGVFEVGVFE